MNYFMTSTKPLAKVGAALALVSLVALTSPSTLAATAAGTEITNLATVTYQDSAGNVYSAESNQAVVTVAQVYSATIGTDIDATAAAGQQVYLPYVLENTGNGPDNFVLSALNWLPGSDDLDSASIKLYHDTNGNGQPDAGELEVSSLLLQAGELANLVVSVQVPVTATSLQTLGIILTAQAEEGGASAVVGSVADLTAGKGRDGLDDTNESLITVTDDAVLFVTKDSVPGPGANQITYTVTVRNNGSAPATDVVIFDGLPEFTSYESSSAVGLLGSGDQADTSGNLDETLLGYDINADGDATDTSEAQLGFDLNSNGNTTDGAIAGVYAVDAELLPNASVSLIYTVSYDPLALGGGYQISNTAHATGDLDGDGFSDTPVDSNVVTDTLDQTFGVSISDTGLNGNSAINDGGDDDDQINGDQLVSTIASGGVVFFDNIITNNGNGNDIFELSVDPQNFPAGTAFTFWDETGTVPLGNTNGLAGVNTNVVASGASVTVRVKASLPQGVSGDDNGNEFEAVVTVTSAGDATVFATVKESLTTIIEATADIHNFADGTIGIDDNPLSGSPDYNAVTTVTGTAGSTVNLPLFIDNEGDGPDSFLLSAGSSWDGSALGALAPGWTVEFFAADTNGDPIGQPITFTPTLPAGFENHPIIAVVSIPADQSQAVGDYESNNDSDVDIESLDGNGDLDGDYPLFFTILASNSGAFDITLDAVDVDVTRAIEFTPNNSSQVDAGGTVSHSHLLSNNGNGAETLEIESSNSLGDWTSAILIDTNGDGTADTELGNLLPGNIVVQQPDGTQVTIIVADDDNDGNPELTIPAGSDVPLQASVFAPANAPAGQINSLTLSATNVDVTPGAPSGSVVNVITVIDGQISLTKTVAVDTDCNNEADTVFLPVQTVEVAPGECAIWEITAVNQGTSDALSVTITDNVTAFTTLLPDSLVHCTGDGCDLQPANDLGVVIGDNIVFYTGDGAVAGTGGTLIGGQQATARFAVVVD